MRSGRFSVYPFAKTPVLIYLHSTQIKVIRHMTLFSVLLWNSILWSDVSLGALVRERMRTREEVTVSGVRGKGRLGASACPLGFPPWADRALNILWGSWDQLSGECRIFSRGKITFSNSSLVWIF